METDWPKSRVSSAAYAENGIPKTSRALLRTWRVFAQWRRANAGGYGERRGAARSVKRGARLPSTARGGARECDSRPTDGALEVVRAPREDLLVAGDACTRSF